jgi:hypothetical protein
MNQTETCQTLQALQRQRTWYIKSRIMVANRLQATVAGTIGYHSGMKEAERTKTFTAAGKLLKQIAAGEVESPIKNLVSVTMLAIDGFNNAIKALEKEMLIQVKQLPLVEWVEQKEQRGFGLLFLAIVIGETGDLSNYANPAKVWKRLGCAPYQYDGLNQMGATWRGGKQGKLPKEEWEKFGYSPRRRSIAYLIGEGIVKQNQDGPYRQRYDSTKAILKAAHPDYKDLRCHLHGMLLATKLLLKNLWIYWNKDRVGEQCYVTDTKRANKIANETAHATEKTLVCV